MTTSTATRVKVGSTFRDLITDTNALFEVTHIDGRHVRAVVVNEPIELNGVTIDSDHAGTVKSFLVRDVETKITADLHRLAYRDHVTAEADRFWNTVAVGTTLHIHNGFDTWIRGSVVLDAGQKRFMPESLVGAWSKSDLPQRRPDGTTYLPYMVARIANKESSIPNLSNVFESGQMRHKPTHESPATLPAICLDLPEVTADERADHARHALLGKIVASAQDTSMSASDRLVAILDLL